VFVFFQRETAGGNSPAKYWTIVQLMQIISSTFFTLVDVPEDLTGQSSYAPSSPSFRRYYCNWGLMHDLEEKGVRTCLQIKRSLSIWDA